MLTMKCDSKVKCRLGFRPDTDSLIFAELGDLIMHAKYSVFMCGLKNSICIAFGLKFIKNYK